MPYSTKDKKQQMLYTFRHVAIVKMLVSDIMVN